MNNLPTLVDTVTALLAGGITEREMLEQPQVECPVVHHFGPGVYMREVSIPAGTLALGHHQRLTHTNVMLKGAVLLYDKGVLRELRAPAMYVGGPGRKMGYITEDVVWLNIYATDEQDVTKLEATYLDKSQDYTATEHLRNELAHAVCERDRADYAALLARCGINDMFVRMQTENQDDQRAMPHGSWKFRIGQSSIQGDGVFCTGPVEAGESIGPAKLDGMRTPLGRFTNHSASPNCYMRFAPNGDVDLVALRHLHGNLGGLPGEEATIDYRQALRDLGAFI